MLFAISAGCDAGGVLRPASMRKTSAPAPFAAMFALALPSRTIWAISRNFGGVGRHAFRHNAVVARKNEKPRFPEFGFSDFVTSPI